MSEIFYTSEYADDNGEKWYVINGDTHYSLKHWTKEEAQKDYLSPESEAKRDEFFRRANGFYD